MTLHWQIGNRVHTEVLDQRRAPYGAQIAATAGRGLEARYGSGFSEKSLRHMIRFAVAFPDAEIVSALRGQLTTGASSQRPTTVQSATRNYLPWHRERVFNAYLAMHA